MPPSKYTDFEEGCVIIRRSTKPPYENHRYIPITCPHCKAVFVDIKETDIKTNKASKCLNHLRLCEAFKGSDAVQKKTQVADEIAELKEQMAEMKQTMAASEQEKIEMKQTWENQQYEMKQEIKGLQDKSGLYDSVLEAVMPSLVLPLTAPVERAKMTLREAAIKDVTPLPLTLSAPVDAIPKEIHITMIEQKDAQVAQEKAHKEEIAKIYKEQLDAKDSELIKANQEKDTANRRAQEANQTATSLSSRADRLQKERDALYAKYNAALKGHEQAVRVHGKHGSSQLSKLQQGQKRALAGVAMEAQTAAAVAFEREFALKRARQEEGLH